MCPVRIERRQILKNEQKLRDLEAVNKRAEFSVSSVREGER